MAIVIAAFAVCLHVAGFFEPLEDRMITARAELLTREPSGEVAIVEIDAKSIAKLKTWPWSRRHHAQLVDRLHGAGADTIAFDVDFSAVSDPAADREFAAALEAAEPVILPIFQQRASDLSTLEATITSRPAAPFEAAWAGGVNVFPDPDGTVREYAAATLVSGRIQPSIASLVAQSSAMGDKSFQPDWGIDARRIPRMSFVDILEGRVPADAIKDKRIIVGATAIELGDRYAIPRYGVVPGVVIQAMAAESLLQQRAITRTGIAPTVAGILAIAILLCVLAYRRFSLSFGLTFAACALILLGGPVLVQASWPISIDTAAMLFTAICCAAVRGGAEIRHRMLLRSLHDAETGLPNRLMFETQLGEHHGGIVVAASIERFDAIRDAIGLAAVTELVKATASRLVGEGDARIYRVAPDTLAWVRDMADAKQVGIDMMVLAHAFRDPVETSAGPVDVAMTFGLDRDAEPAAVLRIERAIAAVSAARRAGDLCQWYDGADPTARRDVSLMGDLRKGLSQGQIVMAYQPKLHLRTRQISDVETLVRWHHPTEGFIPPDRFIPLAESTGVVRELTEFALRSAMADCVRWRNLGVHMRAAVNLSAGDITGRDFAQSVRRLLDEHDLAPSQIALEITESAIIRSPQNAIDALVSLREAGLRLSIDDYGTGQSTLSYLKQLPVHEIKIDKSFITSLCHNRSDAIMVRSTIAMAHELGLEVVAEGIEDEATMAQLAEMGCDYIQGYHVGRPMCFEDLSDLVTGATEAARLIA